MQLVQRFYPVIEKYLIENSFSRDPQALYDPVNYILKLGGKRLRPVLVLAACDLLVRIITKRFLQLCLWNFPQL